MDKRKEELIKELQNISKARIEEIISDLSEIHVKDKITVPNIINNNSMVCFVLSCPGREEMIYGKPCQGVTGNNLNKLLVHLNKKYEKLFPCTNKDHYDILNATQVVHFDELDGCSEGSLEEIENEKQNIKEYLSNNHKLKLVIFLGKKSKMLNDLFGDKSILARHLGFKSVNKIDKNTKGENIMGKYTKSSERTNARIEVIAEEIIQQIDDLIKNGKLKL